MKKIFDEVESLDKNCYERFFLSEDVLMEHAASELCQAIKESSVKGDRVLFVCGPGNNGGDGLAAARILHKEYEVAVLLPYGTRSKMARLQEKRYKAVGGIFTQSVSEADIYVDALFGTGLSKVLDEDACKILEEINNKKAKKISCDIPSGVSKDIISKEVFKADISVSMGAYKLAFFEDFAKDFIGKIEVADLGVSREIYEGDSLTYLLEEEDMKLPYRVSKNSNKGSFGHTCIVMGEKEGAAILASIAALNFGSGLVSVMTNEQPNIPPYIMTSTKIPNNATALVVGMGLGEFPQIEDMILSFEKGIVIDADMFYKPYIKTVLSQKDNLVLTPHPKEFASLLSLCGIADIDADTIQKSRFKWVKEFMKNFPSVTLVLKGANSIIAHKEKIYVNTLGTNALSKGGSGDVLSGMIGSLLAQGYDTVDAAITASLAHSLAAKNARSNNYALNPLDICEGIKCL